MKCFGCYKENIEGYCATCRKKLFDGKKISHVLSFDTPKDENLPEYQEKTKRLLYTRCAIKIFIATGKKGTPADRNKWTLYN